MYYKTVLASLAMLGATVANYTLHEKIDTKKYEGLRLTVYKDSKGFKTIGYGHNLQGGLDRHLEILGLDKKELLHGKLSLTKEQAEELYQLDKGHAKSEAEKLVQSFDDHPKLVQEVLVDLTFNMGAGKVGKFKQFINCINKQDYKTAASALKKSKWYKQVGNRSKEIIDLLKTAK